MSALRLFDLVCGKIGSTKRKNKTVEFAIHRDVVVRTILLLGNNRGNVAE